MEEDKSDEMQTQKPEEEEAEAEPVVARVLPYATAEYELDCYPYTFSPLLLFAQEHYFDKGHSNYNSVAKFFASEVDVDMLANVLYERKNMRYEELLEFVTSNPGMVVTCCIDAHFTAFVVLPKRAVLYYDPLKPALQYISGDSYTKFVSFLLLKCSYGDSQHIQENKDYYTGSDSNATRRVIYSLWKEINKLQASQLYVKTKDVYLNLERYLLVNSSRNPRLMSTQETGNTCYFQTYLFGVLCKVGAPVLGSDGASVEVHNVGKLEAVTTAISQFLLEFFVQTEKDQVMRPLTNSNFVLDFHRYEAARYYTVVTQYLRSRGDQVPDYDLQYRKVLHYFRSQKVLHKYAKLTLSGEMPSTLNTKSLQAVTGSDDGRHKLGTSNYYKYRAANLMFGFNAGIMRQLRSFAEFNSLRKNQLLAFFEPLRPLLEARVATSTNKYRDYYYMPSFELGQPELVALHHYTYEVDLHALQGKRHADPALTQRVQAVNHVLLEKILFSTQSLSNYDKLMKMEKFMRNKEYLEFFLNAFMSPDWFSKYAGLGFSDINLAEKEVNSLTQTVFYSAEMMLRQAGRMEYEFEKECINQMARSTLRKYLLTLDGSQDLAQKYRVSVRIGQGFTYSKYNTLMHFLNVAECYWHNPDMNSIQVFGKDVRALLAVACQKVVFHAGHSFYHYGPIEATEGARFNGEMDLQVACARGELPPYVARTKRSARNSVVVTDRVYEYAYLRGILQGMLARAGGVRLKTDNAVVNLTLLSLLLDFGLFDEHAGLLNLPALQSLREGGRGKRQLQVEVSNLIHEFDKNNRTDNVTRLKVEGLIYEASYKFMINKNFSVHSEEFELIRNLNADPAYQRYVLLCKVYVSLCQINKSVEVDYYKLRCNNDYRIVIPANFSKATSDYLDHVTKEYTFSERDGFVVYDDLRLFDLRTPQPEINLYKVRFDSASPVQSMVKYLEISNVFRAAEQQHLIFIAGNTLLVEAGGAAAPGAGGGSTPTIQLNGVVVEIATVFFNEAVSFVPCFKYADGDDVILFTSRNIHYLVDKGGQFNENYYGMKHELMECILTEQVVVDLNDEHVFKRCKLSELVTESKTVIYAPDYLLQVTSRQQLVNLLDLAIYIRNVSFFILVLLHLRRASIALEFIDREKKVTKITGPWLNAVQYALGRAGEVKYDALFAKQFVDLSQHERLPLPQFIDVLAENFTRYQRVVDGQCQIVPTAKQKAFLQHIITAEECFHFSEVGSGKTKVILPMLCQAFLSNNAEAHQHLARGGKPKHVLVILVPEHLVHDAMAQVYRYCLNLNFREEYRIYDDIFSLGHESVHLGAGSAAKRAFSGQVTLRPAMKQIFITSFNQFKKALTYDEICQKVRPQRERMLVVMDEVDDFLDRDKLVFNICSNKPNAFSKPVLDCYFEVSRAVYSGAPPPPLSGATNPPYWEQLHAKFASIHEEIQEKSRSINKSFGIFNEATLRHCATNIAHDVEGYKSLIARPYESVNRAMPGSYYSDVERTIYLTYYILEEDIAKYDELFQQERKFITFEYFSQHIRTLDYDDLVYGNNLLSELVAAHPKTKAGLTRFLYEVILRRMEIRDKSRSVNSIDVIFNFDCVGFTGTPFIDNYPTFEYIRSARQDRIPDMIDRSFYAYQAEGLAQEAFQDRFKRFQGDNSNVVVEYMPSEFMQGAEDELGVLSHIFAAEAAGGSAAGGSGAGFNVLVDLCGVFKKTTIFEVRDLVLQHFGREQFRYLYHIDQRDGSDRVLSLSSDNDVQFDEEFYKYLGKTYGARLREKVFFFIDNRNVIGKDIPFQLIYRRQFAQPLFQKSVVLAHDVDDFSKIWQAMGRSRTMNDTRFAIYKSLIPEEQAAAAAAAGGASDIKQQPLTRQLYERNCDLKMAGNLSSIYQTLVSLLNLAQDRFYHCNEIVNVFLEKMEMTIAKKVRRHESNMAAAVLGAPVAAGILTHILEGKFQRCPAVAAEVLDAGTVQALVGHVVQAMFEQRQPSGDVHDAFLRFLSGEQQGLMEISYTKQQQKQKQKQHAKTADSDSMEAFTSEHQLHVHEDMDDYFEYTLRPDRDLVKISLNLPLARPVLRFAYGVGGRRKYVSVYPTLQFLYSHHIRAEYITDEVRQLLGSYADPESFARRFLSTAQRACDEDGEAGVGEEARELDVEVLCNHVRQGPQYTLAAIQRGVYIIGMKDQFNIHDLKNHPLHADIAYIADEAGFILHDQSRPPGAARGEASIDRFGPYCIEQYVLMEMLSKPEVAQNVLEYYLHHRERLQAGLDSYSETQGRGFICWRFIHDQRTRTAKS